MAFALLLVGFAAAGFGQPNESIVFSSVRCNDCFAATSFHAAGVNDSHKTAAESGGCQDYPQFNLYENWDTSEANESTQINIRFARWASDADFWYFQIETSATAWVAPFYASTHIEVAFACGSNDGFTLLISYTPNADQVGTGWDSVGGTVGPDFHTADLDFFRDSDGDVGGSLNDGPAVPAAVTTEFECASPACDGYDTLFASVPSSAAFARLRNDAVGPRAMVEIALDRSDFATFLGLGTGLSSDFVPCDARFWQMQTSTLSGPNHFAWNDRLEDVNLDASSWAMDNCGTSLSVPVELMKFEVE